MGRIVGFGFVPLDLVVGRLIDELIPRKGPGTEAPGQVYKGGEQTVTSMNAVTPRTAGLGFRPVRRNR